MLTSYLQTEGLGDYPRKKRLSIYRQAHRELMATDSSYRRTCRQFSFTLCGLVVIPALPNLFRMLGWGAMPLSLDLVTSVLCLALLLAILSASQHFRNVCIAAHLKERG